MYKMLSSCTHRDLPMSSVCTSFGTYRRRYHVRAACQSIAFITLIIGALIYNSGVGGNRLLSDVAENVPTSTYSSHIFQSQQDSSFTSPFRDVIKSERPTTEAGSPWEERPRSRRTQQSCNKTENELLVFYCLGVLYMFLALAIVCDEFFVPALEEMASSRHMNLSMDVAGATLMAAGGSAPELFTNLIGTFSESEIGFGTIVGSAVFNVLFVIAMCAVFAKEVLALTWWPLFRDSVFYTIGLVVLAAFVGYVSPEEIEVWESCVLFGMYFVYCFIMWLNADIYRYLTGEELQYPEEDDDEEAPTTNGTSETPAPAPTPERAASQRDALRQSSNGSIGSTSSNRLGGLLGNQLIAPSSYFSWQGTFRAGILKLLRDPNSWVDVGGMGIVAKLSGDADAVFHEIDRNGDGTIDRDELRRLFEFLESPLSPSELDEVFRALDEDQDGKISEEEFHKWYTTSKELIRSQVRAVFDSLDANNSGTIDKYEVKALLIELDPRVTDEDCDAAVSDMYISGSREEITFEEFENWYEASIIYERQKKAVEEDMEGVWESLKPPVGDGVLAWIQYVVVFPLVGAMAVTIPDVRIPGYQKYCYLAFFASICWIGGFSYVMVSFAETIGNTLGIPSVIMGLTVLAAGTSVPDLLSSVIVARRGSGDMAVSSSIGSNIFDILVGLPVPWIAFTLIRGKNIDIISGSIETNLLLLVAMLVFVIITVHCQGWKLTTTLGGLMMVFYAGYLVQAIWRESPLSASCVG